MRTLRRCEQSLHHAEMWRGYIASALPPCFNADVALPRLLFLEGVPKLDATVLRRHLEQRVPAEHALPEAPETGAR
jgi:hypothetical protein